MQGKLQGFDIRILTQGRFSIARGRAKSDVLTSSLSPGGVARGRAKSNVLTSSLSPGGASYSRALKTEKS